MTFGLRCVDILTTPLIMWNFARMSAPWPPILNPRFCCQPPTDHAFAGKAPKLRRGMALSTPNPLSNFKNRLC